VPAGPSDRVNKPSCCAVGLVSVWSSALCAAPDDGSNAVAHRVFRFIRRKLPRSVFIWVCNAQFASNFHLKTSNKAASRSFNVVIPNDVGGVDPKDGYMGLKSSLAWALASPRTWSRRQARISPSSSSSGGLVLPRAVSAARSHCQHQQRLSRGLSAEIFVQLGDACVNRRPQHGNLARSTGSAQMRGASASDARSAHPVSAFLVQSPPR